MSHPGCRSLQGIRCSGEEGPLLLGGVLEKVDDRLFPRIANPPQDLFSPIRWVRMTQGDGVLVWVKRVHALDNDLISEPALESEPFVGPRS